jgi:hypothetical protein
MRNDAPSVSSQRWKEKILAEKPQPAPEPVLEPVPKFTSDPLGWLQSSLINAGRKDNAVGKAITSILGPTADSLKSMDDPERNPQVTEFRRSTIGFFQRGYEGWKKAGDGISALSEYTGEAVDEGRWNDAWRAAEGWGQAFNESFTATRKAVRDGVGMVAVGLVTTPIRLVTQSVPNFARAIKERFEGKDRTWDVIFSAAMLEGDIAATYGLGKITGVVDRVNLAASRALANTEISTSQTALAQQYGTELPPEARPSFQGWQATKTEYGPGTELYRVHTPVAEGGSPMRPWWTLERPTSELQFRMNQAVLPEWNTAGEMSIINVPEGASLVGWEGNAAYVNGFYIGGGQQTYLPIVPESWITTISSVFN